MCILYGLYLSIFFFIHYNNHAQIQMAFGNLFIFLLFFNCYLIYWYSQIHILEIRNKKKKNRFKLKKKKTKNLGFFISTIIYIFTQE